MTTQPRDRVGTPTGGQFQPTQHDEPDIDLDDDWMVADMPKTSDLPPVVRRSGHYVLRRESGHEHGYGLWVDSPDDSGDQFAGHSQLVNGDLPDTAREDFDTYVDNAEEEMRVLMAEAREEFGF